MVTILGHTRPGRQAGFSLIELLMAMAISTAIMGSVVLVTAQMSRSYYSQLDGAAVQQEGRFALDWVIRMLQSAGNNPLTITVSPCPVAGTTFGAIQRNPDGDALPDDIRIHSDLNGNGLLGGPTTGNCTEFYEDITIAHDPVAKTITMDDNMITGSDPLHKTDEVITGLAFTYLNCNRAVEANDQLVCYIQVTVTSQTPTRNNNTGQLTSYTNSAEIRVRTR